MPTLKTINYILATFRGGGWELLVAAKMGFWLMQVDGTRNSKQPGSLTSDIAVYEAEDS